MYEEKEKMWERELRKIKGLYDNRLRASQQKSSKMEQALTNQTYQVIFIHCKKSITKPHTTLVDDVAEVSAVQPIDIQTQF